MDNHTPEQRHKNMKDVKNKDSEIELLFLRELWSRGLHYRKNYKKITGKPDIVFVGKRVAVFCDSEFWHGYDWENKKNEIKSHREFWIPKIECNMQRDVEVSQVLESTYKQCENTVCIPIVYSIANNIATQYKGDVKNAGLD